MPTNLYGPNDNFDLESAHVLPALIHKFHIAKISNASAATVWGDGTPMREFLHVKDLARACLHLLKNYDDSMAINIGSGIEINIANLANLIADIVGFHGDILFDIKRPNGTPRKLLNSEKIYSLGWKPEISLVDGIKATYDWFLQNKVKEHSK